jgi:hypothetical protein
MDGREAWRALSEFRSPVKQPPVFVAGEAVGLASKEIGDTAGPFRAGHPKRARTIGRAQPARRVTSKSGV